MDSIKKVIFKELISRYDWCTTGRGAPEGLDIEQAVAELGEDALFDAIISGRAIKKCDLCGSLFVARYPRERYCSNTREDGKRCKDLGAAWARNGDPVTAALDAAKRLHLYRRASAGKTEEAEKKYQAWLKFAAKKERECRKGEISIEEFKDAVGKNYTKDKKDRKGKKDGKGKKNYKR